MTSCHHSTLELLPKQKNRLRCRHCHLTINAAELGDSYCPECFEENGEKRYEFEEIETGNRKTARYRCLECDMIIESK